MKKSQMEGKLCNILFLFRIPEKLKEKKRQKSGKQSKTIRYENHIDYQGKRLMG